MSSRAEKERIKAQQDKFQAILSSLLKDDDNKYCVDCDAKGPRWASWNLGIFLCIRCAGIHRNLGVHISRVKSVNLDTWTPEQVAMMQEIGNSRARAAYEANIPDNFRRPQTDSALEAFIRAKYETKKYIAREWVQPKPTIPKEWLEDDREKKRKPKPSSTVQLSSVPKSKPSPSNSEKKASPDKVKAPPNSTTPTSGTPAQPKTSSAAADLIGLDASSPTGPPAGGDLLADIFGNSAPQQTAQTPPGGQGVGSPQGAQQNGSLEANLFEDPSADTGSEKSTKASILALYGSGGGAPQQQQQMFGVPGQRFPSVPRTNQLASTGSNGEDLLHFIPSQEGLLPMPNQTTTQSFTQQSSLVMPSNHNSGNLMSTHQNTGNLISANQNTVNLMSTNRSSDGVIWTNQKSNNAVYTNQNPSLFSTSEIQGNFMQNNPGSLMAANPVSSNQAQFLQGQTQPCYVPSGYCYEAGGVYMPQQNMQGMYATGQMPAGQMAAGQQGMAGGMQYQQGMMGMQQPNMYGGMGQMGGAMMGQQVGGNMMMGGQQGMYPQQQQMQQMQYQQMQQQMGAMKIGGGVAPQMGVMPQAGGGWGQQNSGQTLSTNLWQ